jgi:putative ABC transport system permease protein
MLAKHPGFTTVAVVTLALGIEANTAIFPLVNELFLKPRSGIGRPGQIVDTGCSQDGRGFDNMSYPNLADYRDRNRPFSGVLGHRFSWR